MSTDPTGRNPDALIPVHCIGYLDEDLYVSREYYFVQPAHDVYVFVDFVFDDFDYKNAYNSAELELYEFSEMSKDEDRIRSIVYCFDKGLIEYTGYSPYYYTYIYNYSHYDYGYGTGYGFYLYEPNRYFTRGELWELLGRCQKMMHDEFGVEYNNVVDFTAHSEYDSSEWWKSGRQWAMANGYTDGTNYQNYVTTEQLLEMLYRCLGQNDRYELVNTSGVLDYNKVHSWAKDGVDWALSYGIVRADKDVRDKYDAWSGYFYDDIVPKFYINPTGYVTRAEVANIIYRTIIHPTVSNCLWTYPKDAFDIFSTWYLG